MFIGLGVSCRNSCSVASCFSGLITSVGEEKANFLLLFTCKCVSSVRKSCLFLLVLKGQVSMPPGKVFITCLDYR